MRSRFDAKSRREKSYGFKNIFQKKLFAMSEKQKVTFKVLHTPEDLLALEDEVTQIAGELRDIRQELAKNGMEGVELKSGTFRLFLNKLKQFMPAFKAALQTQKIKQSVDQTRSRYKAKMEKEKRKEK
jgi:hypothetical protein